MKLRKIMPEPRAVCEILRNSNYESKSIQALSYLIKQFTLTLTLGARFW